jgi:hypothetical protein
MGFPTPEGATGWFPFCSPVGWERIKNMCNGEVLGLGAGKCPCPLGVAVPYGDLWAMQMHADYRGAAPAAAPAQPSQPSAAPAPAPAPAPATQPPAAGAPPTTPALPTGPSPFLP